MMSSSRIGRSCGDCAPYDPALRTSRKNNGKTTTDRYLFMGPPWGFPHTVSDFRKQTQFCEPRESYSRLRGFCRSKNGTFTEFASVKACLCRLVGDDRP